MERMHVTGLGAWGGGAVGQMTATSRLNHENTRREHREGATCFAVAGVRLLKGQAH